MLLINLGNNSLDMPFFRWRPSDRPPYRRRVAGSVPSSARACIDIWLLICRSLNPDPSDHTWMYAEVTRPSSSLSSAEHFTAHCGLIFCFPSAIRVSCNVRLSTSMCTESHLLLCWNELWFEMGITGDTTSTTTGCSVFIALFGCVEW